MTTLSEWCQKLEGMNPSAIELGLDRILTVYRRLPCERFRGKTVLVGGTNGKGTTVAALDAMLRTTGKRVLCYTSPHVHRFTERIRIDGREVSGDDLVEAFELVESARQSVPLTYFEFTTLAALVILSREQPDYAVLEVGLGGRLDAVNIVEPDLSIIVSVDLDHQDWLGGDRETIGFEKAGIMRVGVPCLYGEFDPPMSVLQQAEAQRVPLLVWGRDYGLSAGEDPGADPLPVGRSLVRKNAAELVNVPELPLVCLTHERQSVMTALHDDWLTGVVPLPNLVTALQAFVLLEDTPDPGTALAQWPSSMVDMEGRYETWPRDPRIRFDVAHNPHAVRLLGRRLTREKARQAFAGKVIGLFSMLGDKDVAGVVDECLGVVDEWVIWPLQTERAAPLSLIHDTLEQKGANVACVHSVSEAVGTAIKKLGDSDLLVVFGSFFTVKEVKDFISAAPNSD